MKLHIADQFDQEALQFLEMNEAAPRPHQTRNVPPVDL